MTPIEEALIAAAIQYYEVMRSIEPARTAKEQHDVHRCLMIAVVRLKQERTHG